MAKAIKEYDLVFGPEEVKMVCDARNIATAKIARQHFLDKGMTEDEIDKKVKFGRVIEDVAQFDDIDGTPHSFLVGLCVEVEVEVD